MGDLIERQAAIEVVSRGCQEFRGIFARCEKNLNELPSAQPVWKKDIIQKFHDYQVEWLTSHCDLELEQTLEEWVVRFLHDTANCFMMEMERGEQE